jgi:hypothetical protein
MRREIYADDVETEMSEEQRENKVSEKQRVGLESEAMPAQHQPGPSPRSPVPDSL